MEWLGVRRPNTLLVGQATSGCFLLLICIHQPPSPENGPGLYGSQRLEWAPVGLKGTWNVVENRGPPPFKDVSPLNKITMSKQWATPGDQNCGPNSWRGGQLFGGAFTSNIFRRRTYLIGTLESFAARTNEDGEGTSDV